ncbi:MAG: hypothetical protein U1E83_04745 [Methylotetracoccus sp.]
MEWHIDAWDATGGRAFATQRSRNSDIGQPDGETWGPTVFIGPPSFRPEQIANIGIALSARRSGAFDPRVPLDPETDEIEFATADAVADFVRRAFVGSSRNRGGDGGGAIGFEGGPEGPPPSGGGEASVADRFMDEWMHGAALLVEDPVPLALFHGNQLPLTFEPAVHAVAADRFGPVQSGALQVLATVLDGIPRFGLRSPAFRQWQEAAIGLDAALCELGVWNAWFTCEEPARSIASDYLRKRTLTLVPQDRQTDIDGVLFAQLALRWQPTTADPATAADRFWDNLQLAQLWPAVNLVVLHSHMSDRYDAMFSWPLPRYVRVEPACRSVGELLATFVSSPSAFAECVPGTMDIVMFAAALLASRVEDRNREGWHERAAASWLAQSVPHWQFRDDIEALIVNPANSHQAALAGA